jgi:ABC-type Zn uptake system ZnuABC Zn-binding protein ZnuA
MDLRRRPLSAATLAAALVALLAACGSSSSSSPRAASDGRPVVAATVAPVADIVRQVVGDRVQLRNLIPEAVDSHTFEPSPSTVRALAGADVLFAAGLHLEVTTLKQAETNMRQGSAIVPLGDLTLRPDEYAYDFSFPREKGDPNPHLWMDPVAAKRWSELVRDTMVERDPTNAGAYRANQAQFAAVIDQLDPAIRRSIESIPVEHRKLLTYHDSFAYFSRRYGIPVIGAVQPSDFSEPSAREIQRLIEQLKRESGVDAGP